MATCLEKITKANRWRIRTGQMGSDETAGWNGHFICPFNGELWHVIISDGMGFRHLSISNAQKKILPDWSVMCWAKRTFWDDEAWAVQYFPPKSEHINDCEWCLHLWQPLNDALPTPSFVLV